MATPDPTVQTSLLTIDEQATAAILGLVNLLTDERGKRTVTETALSAVQAQLASEQALNTAANSTIASDTAQIATLTQTVANDKTAADAAVAKTDAQKLVDDAEDAKLQAAVDAAKALLVPVVAPVAPVVTPDPIAPVVAA